MIKRVPVEQLRIGMYVHNLNCDWLSHPFLRNRFLLEGEDQLSRIRELGVSEVDIDTELGRDAPGARGGSELQTHLKPALDAAARQRPPSFRATSLTEERARARRILLEASRVARRITEDVRLGRQIELDPARALIRETIASIVRNQDALIGLNRIRSVDLYTFEHSVNVSVLMIAFARALGLDSHLIEGIGLGALLHDVGKSQIPDAILNKPGRLTAAEFDIIRRHVEYGHEILAQTSGIPSVALDVVVEHHERLQGTGYPEGKAGDAISQFGRMAAIVDVYDALTTERVYHGAIPPHEALRKLLEWSPHDFDRSLVHQFIRCVGIYPIGTLIRLESQRLAVVVETGRHQLLKPVVRLMFDIPSRRRLPPHDIDLAAENVYGQDSILSAEDPAKWGLRPEYLLR
ncbi:HD-GYP domain-containing protein [Halochromatium glycolicum]|uniref:Phosphodiesterase n=1 Tax=Halochromatium glycolicum TaxID=85075 RepID=A0AAJ0U343_9GAMM|nr:HD-GYP domain-containing protein [Halochromatium glycolicum]MBK1704408.1 phosphodiesterase [Halochromatium glycolicum]